MTVYETIEYNAPKDLLIVRNSSLEESKENVLLSKSGWTEIPLDEVADILPPTPGHRNELHWPKQRRDSSASQLEEGSAQIKGAGEASDGTLSNHKRVYKRAPIVGNLHACCD
jgi:hypothetical protein